MQSQTQNQVLGFLLSLQKCTVTVQNNQLGVALYSIRNIIMFSIEGGEKPLWAESMRRKYTLLQVNQETIKRYFNQDVEVAKRCLNIYDTLSDLRMLSFQWKFYTMYESASKISPNAFSAMEE